jgi:hypothetical protein
MSNINFLKNNSLTLVFLCFLTVFITTGCDIDKVNANLYATVECIDDYDSLRVELIDLDNNEKTEIAVDENGRFDLLDLGEQNYEVKIYGFLDGTLRGEQSKKFSFKDGYNSQYFQLLPFANLSELEISAETGGLIANVAWNFNDCYARGRTLVYASEDSASVFQEGNLVKEGGSQHQFNISSERLFFGIKLEYSNYENETAYSLSPIWALDESSSSFTRAVAGEWVNFTLTTGEEHLAAIEVQEGKYYLLEAYDGLNDQGLTGTELTQFVPGYFNELRTRVPDGAARFFIARGSQINIRSVMAFQGVGGSFKYRIRPVNDLSPQPMVGQHDFTSYSQVQFAESTFGPGIHTFRSSQTSVFNSAYIYYSILADDQFLPILQNSGFTDRLGPTFRGDDQPYEFSIELEQTTSLRMVMVCGYHGNTGSLFFEEI